MQIGKLYISMLFEISIIFEQRIFGPFLVLNIIIWPKRLEKISWLRYECTNAAICRYPFTNI